LDLKTEHILDLSLKYDSTDKKLYGMNDVRMMTDRIFDNNLCWDEIKHFGNGVFIDEILNVDINYDVNVNKNKDKDNNMVNHVERSF